MFDMFLSGAVSWGVGKALDVLTKCEHCSEENNQSICNVDYNHIECSNCHKETEQFTNACDYTVNRKSKQIGHVLIDDSFNSLKIGYYSDFFTDKRITSFSIPVRVMTYAMMNQPFILETSISSFYGGSTYTDSSVIHANCNKSIVTPSLNFEPSTMFEILGGGYEEREYDEEQGLLLKMLYNKPKFYLTSHAKKEPLEILFKAVSKNRDILYEDKHVIQLSGKDIEMLNKLRFPK